MDFSGRQLLEEFYKETENVTDHSKLKEISPKFKNLIDDAVRHLHAAIDQVESKQFREERPEEEQRDEDMADAQDYDPLDHDRRRLTSTYIKLEGDESCCAYINYTVPDDAGDLRLEAYSHAYKYHRFPKVDGHYNTNLAWLALVSETAERPAVDDKTARGENTGLVTLDTEDFDIWLSAHLTAIRDPILIRHTAQGRKSYKFADYLRYHLQDSCTIDLPVIEPGTVESIHGQRTISPEEISLLAEDSYFGMHIPDFANIASVMGPHDLAQPRFMILDTLAFRAHEPERGDPFMGRRVSCNFNTTGCKGAFSGAHCSILSGTWMQNRGGIQL
jgi:hypothetical protein